MKSSELLRLLKRAGWVEARRSGSHIWMVHPGKPGNSFVFPYHGAKEMAKGTEMAIRKLAGL